MINIAHPSFISLPLSLLPAARSRLLRLHNMDHLILPSNPLHPPMEIPILSAEKYDGGDFLTYPDREGWGPRTVANWHAIFQRPSRAFVAFLERWLFFGFIEMALGERIVMSDFIRYVGNPGRPVITTKHLPSMVQKFIDGIKHSETIRADFALTLLHGLWLHTRLSSFSGPKRTSPDSLSCYENLAKFIEVTEILDPRDPKIAMATSLVMECICSVATPGHSFSIHSTLGPKVTGIKTSLTWRSLAWTLLRGDGWCPSELQVIFKRFNTSALYFLHNISRPDIHNTHQMIQIRKSPSSMQSTISENRDRASLCTSFKCSFKQLHEDTYQTNHVDGCPGCHDVVADPTELCEILENGNIPLILSIDEDNKSEKILFAEANPDAAYVAISHVWADGLGNVQQNAIPSCQLLRLSNMVRNLQGNYSGILLFWLDTICVPPDAAHMDKAQQQALQMMRKTYEDATTVLVLDSWLLSNTSDDKSDVENLMKIFCSAWNTRLWTYQEGALARALHFRFSDATYNLDDGIQRLNNSQDLVLELTLKPQINERYHDLRRFKKPGMSLEQKLLAVASAIKVRTTSVAADEALCLTALLDLDMEDILKTDPDMRMARFWRMLPSVPSHILNVEGTFEIDGLRWAPRTLLVSPARKTDFGDIAAGIEDVVSHTSWATPTDRGLVCEETGILFMCKFANIGLTFFVRDQNRNWYEIGCYHNQNPDAVPYQCYMDEPPTTRLSICPGLVYNCQEVAFIVNPGLGEKFFNTGECLETFDRARTVPGVLVAVYEEKDGITYCRKLLRGTCRRLAPQIDDGDIGALNTIQPNGYYGGPIAFDQRNGIMHSIVGIFKASQRWCIG
jgi:hypothetical protein